MKIYNFGENPKDYLTESHMIKILIMGLPGSGKTFLAEKLQNDLIENGFTVEWFNADKVRERFNDWDFSNEGRIRQSYRMEELSKKSNSDFVICDFVCPLPAMRQNFSADITIWMDTIDEGRFSDTNKLFVPPEKYEYRIMSKSAEGWSKTISKQLSIKYKKESHFRSLLKSITWRFTGSFDTFLISWILTGEIKLALSISGIEFFTKIILYYLHERTWIRFSPNRL